MRTFLILAVASLAACSKSAPPPAATPPPQAMPPGHPQVAAPAAPLPKELQEKAAALAALAKREPRAFAPQAALGALYYDANRYPEAVDAYREALDRAKETLALFDEVQKAWGKPPQAQAGCADASAGKVEANDQQARALRDKGDLAGALSCARQAIGPLLVAMSQRANALFLVGNVDSALAEYDKVLQRDPDLPDALFYTGALLVNRRGAGAGEFARAQKHWKRFLEVVPKNHPHRAEVETTLPQLEKAIANAAAQPQEPAGGEMPPGHPAVGAGDAPSGHPAIEGAEKPADVDQALEKAEEALAKGDGPEAAKLYMGAMSARPDDGRVQAGLAASQFLKGSAMAERVFGVAASNDPKAVDELAERIKKKGNTGLARTLLQRLLVANPGYAEKAKVKERAK
jgi:tetratricopeptide (TPR) repeat protein